MYRRLGICASVVVLAAMSSTAAWGKSCCDRCGNQCDGRKLVKKTIWVPTVVTETRMKSCLVRRNVEREETYTAFERVPKTQKFFKERCYLEDEVKTKKITVKHCKRVKNPVTRTCTVKVPVKEIHERTVRKGVCTRCGMVCVEQTCKCQITRQRTELRTMHCEVNDVVFEKVEKEIDYCVKTPKREQVFCAEDTIYELRPVKKTRTVCVCVPEIVKKPVEVQVVKKLPKIIWCCKKCNKR